MKKTKKWAPNPYAIAQLLADKLDIEFLYKTEGEQADEFLLNAFHAVGKTTLAEAVGLFQQLVEAVNRPMSMAQVMELVQAKRAAELFTVDQLERVLPYLVPLTDAEFAPFEDLNSQAGSARTWFGNSGELMIDDASYLDPIQGAVGNCYLISAMIALAWAKPASWEAGLRAARFDPPEEQSFEWQFHNNRGRDPRRIKISGRIPVKARKKPRYARSPSGEAWPGLVEKAYVVKMRRVSPGGEEPTLADYQAIDRGATPPRACQTLAGGRVRGAFLESIADAGIFSPDAELVPASGVMNRPVMAWTKDDIGVTDRKVWEKTGLWPNHAYAVLGTMRSKHIVLRNPHGIATKVRRGYAEGPWQPDERETVVLNKNGVFAISRALFFKHFDNIGWVEHTAGRGP